MTVAIMTKARPFRDEIYLGVEKNRNKAEKELRRKFPHMMPENENDKCISFTAHEDGELIMLFIHLEEV